MMEEVNFVAEHTLNDHTVDLTFYNVHEYPRDLDYQILGKEEMVLVLSASSPAASKAVEREGFKYPWLDLRLLAEEDFILLYPDQNTGGIALKLFSEYGMEDVYKRQVRHRVISYQCNIFIELLPFYHFHNFLF